MALIDDDEVNVLSQSMPYLEELSISPDPHNEYDRTPKLTLRGLSSIASHCRSLRTIGPFLDVSLERLPPHDAPLHRFSSAFRTVKFGLSPAREPEAIAFRLVRVFQAELPQFTCTSLKQASVQPLSHTLILRFQMAMSQWNTVLVKIEDLRPFVSVVEQSTREMEGVEELRKQNTAPLQQLIDLTSPSLVDQEKSCYGHCKEES